MKKNNIDENLIMNLANTLPGVNARLSTPEEDCGHHKADVVLSCHNDIYYIQVSHTPKSSKENKKLRKIGTYSIFTHRYSVLPLSKNEIISNIEKLLI